MTKKEYIIVAIMVFKIARKRHTQITLRHGGLLKGSMKKRCIEFTHQLHFLCVLMFLRLSMCLGLNPGSASSKLCDFGQVAKYQSVPSFYIFKFYI